MIRFLTMAVVTLMATFMVEAQSGSQVKVVDNTEPAALTLQQQLELPPVPEKAHRQIVAYMRREAESLHKLGYKVETMRGGEIVIATIPTDELFLPNDTVLITSSADRLLKPFVSYLRSPGRYKLLMTVHTDDTGKPEYTFNLSEDRVMALYDWFDAHAGESESLFGFPVGATSPAVENNTRKNRAKNRRMEIYIVPDKSLISSLRNKK